MTEMQPTPAPIGWSVQSQTERTIIDAAGNAVNVLTVYFTLTNGTTGSVNIPLAAVTPDAVRAAINAKAATLMQIAGLTG